jgi:excisionase family DNA binding protein
MTVERPEPDLLLIREAAERLGVSPLRVQAWIDRGLLPVAVRGGPGGQRWQWVRAADVAAFGAWFFGDGPIAAGAGRDATTNDPDWLTVAEVAARFGVGVQTVYKWIRRGLLAAEAHPGKHPAPTYRVRRADARAFAELHSVGKPRPAWLDAPDPPSVA